MADEVPFISNTPRIAPAPSPNRIHRPQAAEPAQQAAAAANVTIDATAGGAADEITSGVRRFLRELADLKATVRAAPGVP